MFTFYGKPPPATVRQITLGGQCPHCKTGTKFFLTTQPMVSTIRENGVKVFIASYSCEVCLGHIPVQWSIVQWPDAQYFFVDYPKLILPVREPFNLDYVPENVKKEIEEALDCLSVGAYNGFAALCRRTIQAICTDLGADATTRVKSQIEEMIELTGLGEEWEELALQIMLSGHDGAHPHLPEVSADRAVVLLSLLQDLAYQLYTRPGKVKEAATLRQEAIEEQKHQD